jgi:hypothetical protein
VRVKSMQIDSRQTVMEEDWKGLHPAVAGERPKMMKMTMNENAILFHAFVSYVHTYIYASSRITTLSSKFVIRSAGNHQCGNNPNKFQRTI